MKSSIISTTADSISSGGTITGDLTISGDLTVSGDSSGAYSEIVTDAIQITKDTDGEFVSLILVNESDAASTAGIVSQRFDLEDTGGTAVDSGKVLVGKEASFTATASTQDSYMAFHTSLNGTLAEKVRIDSSGKVGIGVSPSSALYVASSDGYVINERFTGADTAAPGFVLRKSRGSSAGSFTTVANGDSVGDIYFAAADGNSWHNTAHIGCVVDDGSVSDGAIGGELKFRTSSTSGTMTEHMRIDNAGNIGIGTQSPDTLVEAESSSSEGIQMKTTGSNTVSYLAAKNDAVGWQFRTDGGSSDSLMMYLDGTGSKMTIMTGGNVGIGIDSPSDHYSDELVIACADEGGVTLVASATSHKQYINFADGTSGDARFMGGINYDHNTNVLALRCNGGDPFLLDGNSKISLSNNDSGTDNTVFGFLAGAAGMSGGTDNVLIGDYAGNALTSGDQNTIVGADAAKLLTTGSANVAIGFGALDAADGGEGFNVAIGNTAMGAVDEGSNNSDDNVAIGSDALLGGTGQVQHNVVIGASAMNSTGSNAQTGTVAIGSSALTALTSGGNNLAIGKSAMFTTTTGAQNIAIGEDAMKTNLTGQSNIAIGYLAMDDTDAGNNSNDSDHNIFIGLSSGGGTWADAKSEFNVSVGNYTMDAVMNGATYNTVVGYGALSALTTGDNNNCFGAGSGAALTTGLKNIAIGNNALSASTDVDECVIIGDNAGLAILTGSGGADGSVGIGTSALAALTSGAGNVAVGYGALKLITTGSGNTAFGYGALDAANGAESHNIAIGRDALGNADEDSTSSNIAIGNYALDGIGGSAQTGTIAIGHGSLGGLSSGGGNVAIGYLAADAVTTGEHNTVIGYEAMTAADGDEDENTIIGFQAGDGIDDGNANTIIGSQAGSNDVSLTTGDYNTVIGAAADVSTADAQNQIAIGYDCSAQANNSVTLGNASVTAVYMAQDKGANVHCAGIDVITNNEQVVSSFINDGSGSTDASFVTIQAAEASGQEIGLAFCVGTSAISSLSSYNIAADIRGIPTNSGGALTGDLSFRTNAGDSADERMRILGSGLVGIGDSSPDAHLDVEDLTINTTTSYTGIASNHIKTLGATDASDNFIGIDSRMTFDDDGGLDSLFGEMWSGNFESTCTDSVGESTTLGGVYTKAKLIIGDVNNVYGLQVASDIDGGTVDAGVNGIYIDVDLEGASTVGGEVFGCNMLVDCIEDPGSTVTGYGMNMQTNADFMAKWYDGANTTIRFQVTAAGQVDAEGSINASQALDYAEYFESKNGSVITSGTSVKLDGDKIVACSDGDTPLGVIRPKSAQCIVGGSQSFHWSEKYMKDDYGADIWEDYTLTNWSEEITFEEYSARGKDETGGVMGGNVKDSKVEGSKAKDAVLDDDGNELKPAVDAVPDTYFREHKYHSDRIPDGLTAPDDAETITPGNQRQKLNPDYDESKTYKSREERDEWHIVGLLGQIPITKGQPTGTWIKMKDISDTVEMYFVK